MSIIIQPSKLIDIFQIMYDEKWKYQLGASREGMVDCSGAFAYAFRKLGGYMYHGSNTMWRKYTNEKGKAGQITLVPGMAVFRWRASGKEPEVYKADRQGDFYHVGLYIGNNQVIEAKSSTSGVVKGSVSGWPYAARLTGVDYSAGTTEQPPAQAQPVLSKGSTGNWVTEAQQRLIAHGISLSVYGVDGIFGSETLAAVKAFQTDKGLAANGIIEESTWEALLADPSPSDERYPVLIPSLTLKEARKVKEQYPSAEIRFTCPCENG